MDDPDIPDALHREALDALARVNRLSLAGWRVSREVLRLARSGAASGGRPVRVLDVACGGGDVLRHVARAATRRGVAVELQGCDRSAAALRHARAAFGTGRVEPRRTRPDPCGSGPRSMRPVVSFLRLDALEDPLPEGFDLVACSLFLHHLSREEAVRLLRAMSGAGRTLLVQDLRRSRVSYALAAAGLSVLTRSPVARVDGRRSVRAAFTVREARRLCRRAGLAGARVRPCWPQRFTIRWRAS